MKKSVVRKRKTETNTDKKWLRRVDEIARKFGLEREFVWQEFICGALCWERVARFGMAELWRNNANDLMMVDLWKRRLFDVPDAVNWMAEQFEKHSDDFEVDPDLMSAFLQRVAGAIPHKHKKCGGACSPESAAEYWPKSEAKGALQDAA